MVSNQSLGRTIDQVQAGREKLRSVPGTNVDIGPDVQMPEMMADLKGDEEA
jgi:hypothetical protein